jgi:hypothetical protein
MVPTEFRRDHSMRISAAIATLLLLTAPAFAAGLDIPKDGYVVSDDLSLLPDAVRAKHDALLAAARAGDMDVIKAIMDKEPMPPTVSFGGPDDPIAYLKETSADGEGRELLAILADLLETPYAAMDGGDGKASYVWPYLAASDDLTTMTPADQVVAMQLLGFEGMKNEQELGNWLSWRTFIGEDGDWQAFVAGD